MSIRKQPGITCTYCKHAVPAVKSCLQCEISMCNKHLKKHNTTLDHLLIEPIKSFADRKCFIHKEILKFYCLQEDVCICASCLVAGGDHQDHRVDTLNVASEKKKDKLKTVADTLKFDKWLLEKRLKNLQNHRKSEEGKAAALNRRVKDLFTEIRIKVNALEQSVIDEISSQQNCMSLSVSELIQQLEVQKDKLSNVVAQIEKLLSSTDPLSIMNEKVVSPDTTTVNDEFVDVKKAGRVGEGIISQMLHRGIVLFTTSLMDLKKMRQFGETWKSNILLDLNTAGNNLKISDDLSSATYATKSIERPNLPERFKCSQVLSTCQFTTGKHYWEVDVGGAKEWLIGVAANTIERKGKGDESFFGSNKKSWGLAFNRQLIASHDKTHDEIITDSPITSVGIYLDYEAGHLTFFQLSHPIKCLYTFNATFTEPLKAAFLLNNNSLIKILN